MRFKTLLWNSCISVAIIASAIPAAAATEHECAAGKPTAASYTWDFKGEVNTIFKDIQYDAQQALYHADQLQSFERNTQVSWDAHAEQLAELRGDINDIGTRLCRLETIRRVVAPWQQHAIDRIAAATQLMADNAQDAIVFGNASPNELWLRTYRHYLDNLDNQADKLMRSVDNAVEYSSVSKQYKDLRHDLAVPASS